MLRPNYAQDAPPTTLSVGGVEYNIDTDFRTWINVLHDLRDLIPTPKSAEQALHNAQVFVNIEQALFGSVIDANIADILAAINEFAVGYPEAPINDPRPRTVQTYSFDWDLNYIILAIHNQFGIDLSHKCKHFHFWLFLLYFRALCGDHYILRLMEIRGYDGKDPEMKKQAQRFALPIERTAEDDALADEFNDIFYNA